MRNRAFHFFAGRVRLRAGATFSIISAKPRAADHRANGSNRAPTITLGPNHGYQRIYFNLNFIRV